jgi:hypothetical protein
VCKRKAKTQLHAPVINKSKERIVVAVTRRSERGIQRGKVIVREPKKKKKKKKKKKTKTAHNEGMPALYATKPVDAMKRSEQFTESRQKAPFLTLSLS